MAIHECIYKFIVTGLFSLLASAVFAQNKDLDDLIQIAKTTSPVFSSLKKTHEAKTIELESQLTVVRPTLSINTRFPGFTRAIIGVTQPDGSLRFTTQSQAYSSFNMGFNQKIALTGGNISVGTGLNRIDLYEPNRSVAWSSNLFIISYSQPLFQFNDIKYLRKNIRALQEIQNAEYQEKNRQFEGEIAGLLLDYLIVSNQKKSLNRQLSHNSMITERMKDLINAGKVLNTDLTLVRIKEMQIKNQLYAIEVNLESLRMKLSFHFGNDMYEKELSSFNLQSWSRQLPSEEFIISQGRNSSYWLSQDKSIEEAKQNIERQRRNSGFSATIDVSFGLNQRADEFLDVYQNPLDRQTGSISLTIPVLDGGRSKYNKLIAEKALELAKLQKEISAQSMGEKAKDIVYQFQLLNNKIITDSISLRFAEEHSNHYFNLLNANKITTEQYMQAQNQLEDTELSLLSAYADYWRLWYSFWF